MSTVLLEAKNVSHSFNFGAGKSLEVLRDISLDVHENEIVVILGPSGSGKSTLLRLLTGLLKPAVGTVQYRGELVEGPNPRMAMVFQNFALFPWLTVQENIAIGLSKLPLLP